MTDASAARQRLAPLGRAGRATRRQRSRCPRLEKSRRAAATAEFGGLQQPSHRPLPAFLSQHTVRPRSAVPPWPPLPWPPCRSLVLTTRESHVLRAMRYLKRWETLSAQGRINSVFLNQGNNSPETDIGRRFLNCRYCSAGTGPQSQPFCPLTFDQYTPMSSPSYETGSRPPCGTPAPPCCCTECSAIALVAIFGVGLYMTGPAFFASAAQALQLAQMGGPGRDLGAVGTAPAVAHHPPPTGSAQGGMEGHARVAEGWRTTARTICCTCCFWQCP